MNTETLKEIFHKVEFFQDPIITASQQNNDFRVLVEPGNEFPFVGVGYNDLLKIQEELNKIGLSVSTIWTNFDKPSAISFHIYKSSFLNENN